MKLKKVIIKSKDKLKRKMIENTIDNIGKFKKYLDKKLYLLNKYENNESIDMYEKLSPIKIDSDLYLTEIDHGLFDEDIKNIALSGPYGIGKSSILKTYIHKRPLYNYLSISLANFTKKEGNESNKVDGDNVTQTDILSELESNILKQMFYKVKQNKIPYSRYRRIKKLTNAKILSIIAGIALLLFTGIFLHKPSKIKDILAVKKNDFINVNGFQITIVFVIFIVISLVFLINIIKYVKSNLRLNNIQFKNMEMSKFDDKEFIFNKNIDEIIYFFEVTNYDVVIFEDLDRFDNIDIFIKLRELNELINNSQQIGRKITFIYAIKDEIFEEYKDRTKFFDFIIPVVPIMNSSNSAEKMKEKLKLDKSEQATKLNKIIDDVSLYIEDVRLVTNICNEFKIYKKILENAEQDKLFAIIVYKNIYPKDFAELQFNKGMLADIFNFDKKQTLINSVIRDIKEECIKIENKIEEIKKETINDIHELRIIYLEVIFKQINSELSINGERYDYDSLIDRIFNEETSINNHRLQYNGYTSSFNKDIRIMLNYDNEDSYYNREKLIKLKEDKEINKLKMKLSNLKKKINVIHTYRIQELIQEFGVDNVIINEKARIKNLLIYLVKNGYIDEMYDSYIVQLKSGSLTKNDVDFIKMVQGQFEAKYEYTVNNPSKVINSISANDCKTVSILNYNLIEFMILNKDTYKAHYSAVLNKLSDESKESKEFINLFISSKKLGYELLSDIAKVWTGIWRYIETESNYEQAIKDKLLIHLITSLSIEEIVKIDEENILTEIISRRIDFFELVKDIDDKDKIKKLLTRLCTKFKKLYRSNPVEAYDSEMIEYIYNNCLYEINKEMIEFIIEYKYG